MYKEKKVHRNTFPKAPHTLHTINKNDTFYASSGGRPEVLPRG